MTLWSSIFSRISRSCGTSLSYLTCGKTWRLLELGYLLPSATVACLAAGLCSHCVSFVGRVLLPEGWVLGLVDYHILTYISLAWSSSDCLAFFLHLIGGGQGSTGGEKGRGRQVSGPAMGPWRYADKERSGSFSGSRLPVQRGRQNATRRWQTNITARPQLSLTNFSERWDWGRIWPIFWDNKAASHGKIGGELWLGRRVVALVMEPDESTPMRWGARVSWFPIWRGWQNAAMTAADSSQIFRMARSAANSCRVDRTAGGRHHQGLGCLVVVPSPYVYRYVTDRVLVVIEKDTVTTIW
jgi:hypothetical protein